MNSKNTEAGKIIIVDDDHFSVMIVKEMLLSDGYCVQEVESSALIIEEIQRHDPDLILLDLVMPEVDSLELCKNLKKDPKTYLIPVIFMSVTSDRRNRLKCIEAGGVDLLNKPLDSHELSTRVKSLIDQKRLYENLDQTEQVLFALAKAIEDRHKANGDSPNQLPHLAQGFSQHLRLSDAEIQNLTYAAHLHDIGTVAIPDSIMLKTEELTAEEREIINQHVLIGEKICEPIKAWRGVLPIIRNHHERWDGSGYPDGLEGNQIPFLAQVFQIIDIYDALTSERPHKKPLTPEQALAVIWEESKKGWRNPELVKDFSDFVLASKTLANGVKVFA